jgi:hypothetical protein
MEALMKKNPNLLWIVAILLGWLFDFLFWQQSFGINFAIFTVCCLLGGFLLLWFNGQRPARGTLWLIPLILFFAAITFLRAEPLTVFLGALMILFLMVVLANTFLGGRWFVYSLADYVAGFFKLMGSMLAQPVMFNSEVSCERKESGRQAVKINIWPTLRGILIAIPILAIFAALLASADSIFGNQLSALLKLFFGLNKFPEYIFRLFYILLIAYGLAGAFLHAALHSRDEKLIGEEKPLVSQFLGFTETAIVLGSVIVLFAAFVVIQVRYLFGGLVNINIAGFTYSEYARRGFGELIAVAFLSLLMIMGFGAITHRESQAHKRAYSGLSIAIVLLVMVMLISAYQRLNLYEVAYGFSRLRTYTYVALVWIGVLLLAAVLLEFLRREHFIALAVALTSLGLAVSLSLLNVDGFIVRHNVERAMQGQSLDVQYLVSFSSDAIPVLVDEFHSASLTPSIHEKIGAILVCHDSRNPTNQGMGDWRSFTLSGWMADNAIKRVQAELNGYHVNNNNDSETLQVQTPSTTVYRCN